MTKFARFLAWLRKPGSGGQIVPQMEGLRFVALWMVFFLHFNQAVIASLPAAGGVAATSTLLFRLCQVGDFGVQLFFAISGFVLALPFARWRLLGEKPVSLKRYFVRRLIRLEPPLLINLLLMIPLTVFVFHKMTLAEVPHHFLWTIGYAHRLLLGENSPLNRVTWSLETEAQFYLAMPLLAGVFLISSKTARRGVILVLAASCLPWKDALNKALLLAQIEYFALGLLLADLYLVEWSQKLGQSRRWDGAGVFGWLGLVLALLGRERHPLLADAVLPVCVFLAFAAALRGRFWHWLWGLPWLTLIGGMCYTFYLYHDPLIKLGSGILRRLLPAQPYWAQFSLWLVLIGSATLAASMILFALFERPFMGWKGRKSAAAPPLSPNELR